jgi:hypothetical protein
MKVPQSCSGEETHTVWTGTIKRLIHRYLEDRNKRRALRCDSAEKRLWRLTKDVVGAMRLSES